MSETRMVGLGDKVLVDSGHSGLDSQAFDELLAFAERSKTHLWGMNMVHRMSVTALEQMQTVPPLFDQESLLFAAIGCQVCEQPYEPRLLRRACPGDPSK